MFRRALIQVGDALVLLASAVLLAGFVMLPAPPIQPLPDFAAMDTQQKKREFFAYLSPIVARVNYRFVSDRDRLAEIAAEMADGSEPSWFERRWIEALAERLEVPLEELPLEETIDVLQRRIGIVPESLVLAQAAKESGWGTSRFAIEGNNLFGQRCYRPDCGIVPRRRAEGARFGVAAFDSIEESVESYVLNLNTHPSYLPFREVRQALRQAGKPVTGLALIDGLHRYSERGEMYVDELEALIRQNGLE